MIRRLSVTSRWLKEAVGKRLEDDADRNDLDRRSDGDNW